MQIHRLNSSNVPFQCKTINSVMIRLLNFFMKTSEQIYRHVLIVWVNFSLFCVWECVCVKFIFGNWFCDLKIVSVDYYPLFRYKFTIFNKKLRMTKQISVVIHFRSIEACYIFFFLFDSNNLSLYEGVLFCFVLFVWFSMLQNDFFPFFLLRLVFLNKTPEI